MISKMQNYPKENYADKIIGQIINKPLSNNLENKKNKNNNNNINNNNINNINDNYFFNYGNNNADKRVMNNNYVNNKIPLIKPINNLPSLTLGKNKKVKIEYGVIKYNSYNKNKKKNK